MKFISSSYDKNTGVSKVIMQHLGIKFTGTAKAHPDELDPSEYAGCYYAELRATIKALKYERTIAKGEADICRNFVKSIECYSKFNKDDESAKSLYRQLNQKIKRVNDLADEINDLYKRLDMSIHRRDIVIKAIHNNKKSK